MLAWTGLADLVRPLRARLPTRRAPDAKDVQKVLDKAVAFLQSAQAADGSFSPKFAGPGVTASSRPACSATASVPTTRWWPRRSSYLESRSRRTAASTTRAWPTTRPASPSWPSRRPTPDGKYDTIIKNAAQVPEDAAARRATPTRTSQFGGVGYDGKTPARPVQHAVLRRGPARRRRAEGRPGHQEGARSSSAAARTCPARPTTSRSPRRRPRTTRAASSTTRSTRTTSRHKTPRRRPALARAA